MNAVEKNVYGCSECKKVFWAKEAADNCCRKKNNICRICGCEVNPPRLICHECKDKERFDKANKVKYSEYSVKWLWDEVKQDFFYDAETLAEKYGEDAYEEFGTDVEKFPDLPEWAYGCIEITFQINIDWAIENAEEKMHEDFDDIQDEKGLRDFVKEWNAKQTGKSYEVDYSTVVLLNE